MIRDLKKCNICESDDFTILHYYEKHYYDSKKFIKHSWDGDLDLDDTSRDTDNDDTFTSAGGFAVLS